MIRLDEQWQAYKGIGVAGWNTFIEADQIQDTESPDVSNIIYRGGFLSPRPGSSLFAAKPSHATLAPLQTIEANTSDGIDYIIAVYGNQFFLRNPLTDTWVRLNPTYVPSETTLPWAYINWNNGRGDDRLYGCNGVNSFFRWDMCVTTVAVAASAGATTVTLTDATRFPTSGTVIFKSGGTEFSEAYTSKTGNVLNLTGTLNANVSIGDSVVAEMVERASMEKGKVLGKHQSRLFVCNRFGAETSGFYSVTNSPENFTTGTTVSAASSFTIADGNGGITALHDFGKFLLIEKEDSLHSFEIIVSEDLGSKLDKIQPIISGVSVGAINQQSSLKYQNSIYYPTSTEGIMMLNPTASGDSASTGLMTISQPIQNYVLEAIEFAESRVTVHKQHILWTVRRTGASENSIVLVFDMLRKAWSRWDGFGVKDWARANGKLYYMENGSGDIIECFKNTFDDNNNPYNVSFYTKRFNFGVPAQPKVNGEIYVEGYMTPATELYADVFYNEGCLQGKMTFKLEQGTPGLLFSEPLTNALGQAVDGTLALGYVQTAQIGNVSLFRCYLGSDITVGYHNVQVRFYSNKQAFWGITGLGFNPILNQVIDPALVVSPIITT